MQTFIDSSQVDNSLIKIYSELTVHFQPIFSSKDGKIYGYEALARHRTKNINILELFNSAKINGTLCLLDMICRRNALKEATSQGINEYLFINICPDTFLQDCLDADVTERLTKEFAFPKEKIVLEIAEYSIIDDYKPLLKKVFYYKELGFKIAIDDFGAGFGGLKLLSMISPDFVKIDRYFVRTIYENFFSKSFVEFILNACHTLDIMVIAEGIENYQQLSECVKLGVDYLQGFYLGKPQKNIYEFQLCYASQ